MSQSNNYGKDFYKRFWKGLPISGILDGSWKKFIEAILNKYTGARMTGADKEKLEAEDKISDENADVAYQRQKEFQDLYLTPEAQIKSQAEGYDAIGMNRMLLAGSQPGASASSVPTSAGGTAGSSAGNGDILGFLTSLIGIGAKVRDLNSASELKAAQARHQDIVNKWEDKRQEIQYKNEVLASRLSEVNIRKITAEAENSEWLALYAPDLFQSQIDERNANVSKAFSDIDKNVSDIAVNDARIKEINSIISKNKHEIDQIDALTDKIKQEYWNLVAEEDLTKEQIKECTARTAKWNEEVKEIASRIGLNEADLQWYVWNHPRSSSAFGLKWNKSSFTGSQSIESIEGWSTPQLIEELKKRGALSN